MKSRTKNLLSEEQIINLVKVNFGDSCQVGTITELTQGMFNSAYLIERLNEKDKMVLKVSVTDETPILSHEKVTMYTEVEIFKMLAQQTTIPTPKLLAYDFSKKHVPSYYFFMTAMEGETMNKIELTNENRDSVMKELAGYLAQQHRIKGQYFGHFTEDKQHQFTTWKEAFLDMMNMILNDGKVHGTDLPFERYEKLLMEKGKCLEQIKEPSLVNYDLSPPNIFLKKQGDNYVIEGIIDFERGFWGDPYADFPSVLPLIEFYDMSQEPSFWEAYKEAANIDHDFSEEEKIRLLLYKLYLFTLIRVEAYRYDPDLAIRVEMWSKNKSMSIMDELDKF